MNAAVPNDPPAALVSDEAVTPDASVAPVSVPAAAVTVILAVPSKDTPLIVLAVCRAVAVPALPVTEVWSPVLVPLDVPEWDPLIEDVPVTARVGVLDPEMATPLNLPPVMSPVVSAIVTAEFWTSFPVVPSNRATALSVALDGPTTSPDPPPPPVPAGP